MIKGTIYGDAGTGTLSFDTVDLNGGDLETEVARAKSMAKRWGARWLRYAYGGSVRWWRRIDDGGEMEEVVAAADGYPEGYDGERRPIFG